MDDADLELENCLEGEEWMFKTFNRKKLEEARKAEEKAMEAEQKIVEIPISHRKPPQPTPKPNLDQPVIQEERVPNLKKAQSNNEITCENNLSEKPKRRQKHSRHRRTQSKTFDKDFLQSICST